MFAELVQVSNSSHDHNIAYHGATPVLPVNQRVWTTTPWQGSFYLSLPDCATAVPGKTAVLHPVFQLLTNTCAFVVPPTTWDQNHPGLMCFQPGAWNGAWAG